MVNINFRRYTVYLLFFAGISSRLHAQQINGIHPDTNRVDVYFSAGFQSQDLRWSIAGNSLGQSPNIYSELIWRELQGPATELSLRYQLSKRLSLEGNFKMSWFNYGKVSDRDYQSDNRTYVSFDDDFDSNRGHTTNLSGVVAYDILKSSAFQLVAGVGYTMLKQQLYLLDNKGIYNGDLQSTYDTNWNGPIGKLNASVYLSSKFRIIIIGSYSQTKYTAVGNWNLISNFEHPASYRHTANGYGLQSAICFNWQLNKKWAIFIKGDYGYWKTGTGIDVLYLTNGQQPQTQMNGVIARNYFFGPGISLGLGR